MLCHFGQARNGYVATRRSSATSGYLIVPEHLGQSEEPAGSNEDRTKEKPSFATKMDFSMQ